MGLADRSYMYEPRQPNRPPNGPGGSNRPPKNERKVRKVWATIFTIIFGILLAIQVVDDVGPHTKNNPLSSNTHATIFFGLAIIAIQWRAIKRHTKIGSLSRNTLRWMGGISLALIVSYLVSTPTTTHLAPTSTTPNSSVVIMKQKTVSVVKSGFTQSTGDIISYGLILRNESASLTALDISVTTTFLDSLGRSIGSDGETITGVPPEGVFNVGGSISPNISLTVSRLQVSLKIGGLTTEQLILPSATNVKATPGYLGSVIGSLHNPYNKLLPSNATIYIVYLNAKGQIVGGDNETAGAAVTPDATVTFSDTLLSMTVNKATVVRASVDPDGFPVPGSGTIRWTSS